MCKKIFKIQYGLKVIWLGGSDWKQEGRFLWNDENDTELRNGYSNWNFGQVNIFNFYVFNKQSH